MITEQTASFEQQSISSIESEPHKTTDSFENIDFLPPDETQEDWFKKPYLIPLISQRRMYWFTQAKNHFTDR